MKCQLCFGIYKIELLFTMRNSHISQTKTVAFVIQYSKLPVFTDTAKAYCMVIALMICYATMATKQHSIVDVLAGVLLSAILYYIYPFIYKRWGWLRKL